MIIGTMRAEEAKIFDQYAGYHPFHAEETQEPYGSFEIFFNDALPLGNEMSDGNGKAMAPGWYWWACRPECLPDGDPCGPFAMSRNALEDADEWAPEFDE